ncbi:MAG: AAA family ATPase [Phycisphaerae bacterium]|nr:AAA family ATPase [Phycisphaerae bacterium]
MPDDDLISTLRQAVELSPNNLPLRRHLAETLLTLGHSDEAQKEFRAAIALAPDDLELKLGLARAFAAAGKMSAALVVVEDLLTHQDHPPKAQLLYARLLRGKHPDAAAKAYRRAVEADPSLADPMLARQLGESPSTPYNTGSGSASASIADRDEGHAFAEIVEDAQNDNESPEAGDGTERLAELEKPRLSFADVGGMEKLKEEIAAKILLPIRQPELYKAYGKKAGGGILMYGPPGCGKTFLARATAGEVRAGFIAVGIHDVLDMWIGSSERNLHAIFQQAREHAPCVLFFDEVDALGASRSDMRGNAGRHLINQFLAEMDGAKSDNDGVLILAATNAPWHLDSAFRRPGRFDRVIFVPPPDADARAAILRLLLRDKPSRDIDHETVARKADHFSGADLAATIELAVEAKLRDAARTGHILPLTTKDLLAAMKDQKPTTREWFATARNHAVYSNVGGIYDDILKYLKLL